VVVVHLALALICFDGDCHPALLGRDTPPGRYTLSWRGTDAPGYGGDLLVFRESSTHVWAIHRVLTLLPSQRRVQRLTSGSASARREVTAGCVNLMPEVYAQLVDCCRGETLLIRR
jgi:hypothetical protein